MALFSNLARRPSAARRRSAADLFYEEIGRETPEAGQKYLNQTTSAALSSAMPDFEGRLQDLQESSIRRGVSGGLGTFYEGSLASAFQRNIANATSSRASDMYENSRSRYLDMLAGTRDYETAKANAKRKRGGLFGKVLGTVAGSFLGPLGAAAGERLGGRIFK